MMASKNEKRVLPLSYYGSKGELASWILSYFPPHQGYLEMFGGGGALLLLKQPAAVEVYNDKSRALVTFFRVLRDESLAPRLIERLRLTPYSREEFVLARRIVRTRTISEDSSDEERLEMAWAVFVCLRQGFGGTFRSGWGYDANPRQGSNRITRYLSAISHLEHWVERLRRVQIECLDWRDVADRYNFDSFLWYLDPPYVPESRVEGARSVYLEEMKREEHEEMVDYLLTRCKAKVILSGYPNSVYERLERHGWTVHFRNVKTQWSTSDGVLAEPRVECLWISPNIDDSGKKSFTLF